MKTHNRGKPTAGCAGRPQAALAPQHTRAQRTSGARPPSATRSTACRPPGPLTRRRAPPTGVRLLERLDNLPELLYRLGVHAERAGDTADGSQMGRTTPYLDVVDAAGCYPGLLGQCADAQQPVCPKRTKGWHGNALSTTRRAAPAERCGGAGGGARG